MTQTFESGYSSTLSQKFSSTDTVMYVATPPTVTAGRIYLTDGSQKERVSFSWVSGSTLTWCVRGLSRVADPVTAWTWLNWLAGTPIVLVAQHDQLLDKTQPTDPIIYAKIYATTAARDTALWADWVAAYPYTNVYVTATWLHYNYNISSWVWESIDTGTSTPNGSTTVAGKYQSATVAQAMARTQTGSAADLVITPDNLNVINLTALENLTAWQLVSKYTAWALKTRRWFATAAQVNTTTGLDTSTTENMIKCIQVTPWTSVAVYKKSADNKLYATVTTWDIFQVATVWAEKLLSADVLEANDWFDVCPNGLGYNTFSVVYKLASDDKVYGIACTVSWQTITAGSHCKLYDTNIVQSWTRPTCCSSFDWFLVWFHDDVTDDPTVVPCSVDGTTITPWSAVAMETVTMNAAWQVLMVWWTVQTAGIAGIAWCFYDDWTNIRFNNIVSGTTPWTPCSLTAWYVTWSMKALQIESWVFMLFTPWNGSIKVQTVNDPDAPYGVWTSYYTTTDNYVIQTNTKVNTLFDVCTMGIYKRWPGKNYWTPMIWLVNYATDDDDTWTWIRFRKFQIWSNWLVPVIDAHLGTNAVAGLSVCNNSTRYRDEAYIIYADATKLMHSLWLNTEELYVWVVKTTTLSWATVPVITHWPATITWIDWSERSFVWHNGATLGSYWTRAIGIWIATDTILLQ